VPCGILQGAPKEKNNRRTYLPTFFEIFFHSEHESEQIKKIGRAAGRTRTSRNSLAFTGDPVGNHTGKTRSGSRYCQCGFRGPKHKGPLKIKQKGPKTKSENNRLASLFFFVFFFCGLCVGYELCGIMRSEANKNKMEWADVGRTRTTDMTESPDLSN
jgi:hypothetical protein